MNELNNEITKELVMAGRFLRHRHGRPSGQEHILKLLSENGPMSQRDLQDLLEVRPGSVSEICAKLEKYEFIRRQKDEDDSRLNIIELTAKGKRRVHELKKTEEEDLYTSLNDEEKQNLKDILYKLNNDWVRRAEPEGRMCHRPMMRHGMPRPMGLPEGFTPLFRDRVKEDKEEE